ncbi:MAG: hypothetical protein JWQ35_1673 [Bacteriovoracaceae bacterium]|nr:hypothetical protein [Bacteriovoracaceae bacterium]
MEKIWFHHFRLRTFTALAVAVLCVTLLRGEEADVKSVIVDVETTIEDGNLAAAKQTAQKLAFEKALEQVLPSTMDSALRAQKIKKAAQSIKSFQVVEEKIDGALLRQKYKCDVIYSAEVAQSKPAEALTTFEIAWLPDEVQFNAVDLLKFVSEVLGSPASSVRIGRGNVSLSIPLKKSLEETQTQLANFVGRRGLVKVIHRDENRAPDMIAAPFEIPSPTPVAVDPMTGKPLLQPSVIPGSSPTVTPLIPSSPAPTESEPPFITPPHSAPAPTFQPAPGSVMPPSNPIPTAPPIPAAPPTLP